MNPLFITELTNQMKEHKILTKIFIGRYLLRGFPISKMSFFVKIFTNFRHLRCKRFYSQGTDIKGKLISIPEIKSFVERCMTKVGSRPTHATELAEVLVAADHRGHFSHGLNRLGKVPLLRY